MLGIPLRYLLTHPRAAVKLTASPAQLWATVVDVYVSQQEQRRPQCPYEAEPKWEERFHAALGVPWPCSLASEFWTLWRNVIAELEAKGIRPGPESFGSWNDGDAGFVRAIWCLVRHSKPSKIVETGVAHGVTSRFILEALNKSGSGHLWSIDVPPIETHLRHQVGAAVGDHHAARWTYIAGSSRLRLPALIAELGPIDLFIHDSMHSERNVRFEMDRAWPALTPNGAILVDDIDANYGFRSFNRDSSGCDSFVCEAEPIRADLRRFNQKGLFGIVLKKSATRPALVAAAAAGG